MKQVPPDYAIRYQYYSEPTPPPDHYQYTIRMDPSSGGEVVFCPDYHEEHNWIETFNVETGDVGRLYSLMLESEVFAKNWSELKAADPIWLGVSGEDSESFRVTAHGDDIEVSCHRTQAEYGSINQVYAAIKALVPETVWGKLTAQQEEYKQDYFKPVVGSLVTDTGGHAFIFDPETALLKLDIYTQVGSEVELTEIQKRRDELRIRRVSDNSVEEIRIGEYFCDSCGTWAKADRHQWSLEICVSCAMDRASEMSEYYHNLPQMTLSERVVSRMVRIIKRLSRRG
jgi:hypothetical protein